MKKILIKITVLLISISLIMVQAVYAAPPKTLSDVKGHWAEVDIQSLLNKGIITGNGQGKYEPNKSITRAEFTALLIRAMGLKLINDKNSFFDVGYLEFWGKPYIETAVLAGIIIPTEIGAEFNGNVPLKRLEMAVMMTRALNLTTNDVQENPYIDMHTPNNYVTKLYHEYLMRGYTDGGKVLFKPNNQTTKAEAATVISRLLQYKADPKEFIDKAALEERLKSWAPTQEDIDKKLQEELKKQEQSKTYIMEPIIEISYNDPPYQGYYFHINLRNSYDYSGDCSIKFESLSHPQLNVVEQVNAQGNFVKYVYNEYKPLGNNEAYNMIIYTLRTRYYTTQANLKTFKLSPGEDLTFKVTIKRGTETRSVTKVIKMPISQ